MIKIDIRVAALRLISRRGYFSEELAQKLSEKGYEKGEIEGAIRLLTQEGFLNDEERLNRFRAQKRARGYGPALIRWQLRGKSNAQFEMSAQEEEEAIHIFLKRRKIDLKTLDFKRRQSLFAALQRRGFSIEAIMKTCKLD